MSRVASLCAIIDSRSLFGGWLMRSFQSFAEIARAFHQFGLPLVFGRDHAVRAGQGGGDVGPARQLAAVLPGEVEQHGEHLRGQLDRDLVDPVEHLVVGRLSRHSAERLRMLIASWSRWVGVNIGATVLRCALWRG